MMEKLLEKIKKKREQKKEIKKMKRAMRKKMKATILLSDSDSSGQMRLFIFNNWTTVMSRVEKKARSGLQNFLGKFYIKRRMVF